MSYSRIKVWIAAEILTASDLNNEHNGHITNENDLDSRLISEITTRSTLESEHDVFYAACWNAGSSEIAANRVSKSSMKDDAIGLAEIEAAATDPAAGTGGLRTLGTTSVKACAGNDSRLSDQRVPTNGSVVAAKLGTGAVTENKLGTGAVTENKLGTGAVTHGKVAIANKDGAAGTPSMRTLGTTSVKACAGNDSRLSNERTPPDNGVTVAKMQHGSIMLPFWRSDETEDTSSSDSYETIQTGFKVYVPVDATIITMNIQQKNAGNGASLARFFLDGNYSSISTITATSYAWNTTCTLNVSGLSGVYTMGVQHHKTVYSTSYVKGFSFFWS